VKIVKSSCLNGKYHTVKPHKRKKLYNFINKKVNNFIKLSRRKLSQKMEIAITAYFKK